MSSPPVLIVGAGPTGLVLALWLRRLGVHVRIVDKAAEPGTTSRAVAIQARTLELYRHVNISDAVVGGGVKVAANYRNSPLSIGTTGAARGGDRLPWVEIGPAGEDNFTPLASLCWQAHFYGEAPNDVAASCAELGLPLHVFAWHPGMRSAGLRRDALYVVRRGLHCPGRASCGSADLARLF